MKTMYDTKKGVMCICTSALTVPPLYLLCDPVLFFQVGAVVCADKKMNPTEFRDAANGCADVADLVVELYSEPRMQLTYREMIDKDIFDIDTAIDVTGYSLNKLHSVILASIEDLKTRFNTTIH